MKSTITLLLTFTATLLSHLPTRSDAFVYPITPISNTVWKPEQDVTISWSDDKHAPLLSSNPIFDIFLMTGADDKQKKLATIASNVDGGTTTSVKYHVPHVSPPGQIYFLMFQTKDGNGMAWATRFTITDSEGNRGTLRPVIPEGGTINPGGIGAIISSSVKHSKSHAATVKPAAALADPTTTAASVHAPVKATSATTTSVGSGNTQEKNVVVGDAGSHKESSGLKASAGGLMAVAVVVVAGGLQLLGF
ncbi:hypothetical protein EC957_005999 [Mortierella hygrophila]|uniref:Yeast cell wall synthesis Kre9/Knh1-like N-terminal domain-containing protein n=1 Tax=Mortierella hygrophila TaxID=979708 RepID=A0A9P6EZK5_9FUNG|nr:hypothetical protein EC957_005999 [Mortierella hygrophila]